MPLCDNLDKIEHYESHKGGIYCNYMALHCILKGIHWKILAEQTWQPKWFCVLQHVLRPRGDGLLFTQIGDRAQSLRRHSVIVSSQELIIMGYVQTARVCVYTWVCVCLKFRLMWVSFCRHDEISGGFYPISILFSLTLSQCLWSQWAVCFVSAHVPDNS